MRIIHVIPSLRIGGAEKMCIDICNTLSDQGHDVLLVCLNSKHEFDTDNFRFTLQCIKESVGLRFLRGITSIPPLWSALLKTFKPDIIHSHLFEAEIFAKSVVCPGVAYFTHCHDNMKQFKRGYNFFNRPSKKEITRLYERRFLLNRYKLIEQNCFVCISEDNYAYFNKNLPESVQLFKLPNAISLGAYNKNISLPRGELKLITIGSLTPLKNQAYLIWVVEELRLRGLPVTLEIIGDGPMYSELSVLIDRLSLTDVVFLRGKQKNTASFYQKNHLYVHSAQSEGFGLTQIEAMASGLPVVALDAGGNREIIHDGFNGFLVNKKSPPVVFAEKIARLWEEKTMYSALQQGANETASQFDIGPYCEKLVALYKESVRRTK